MAMKFFFGQDAITKEAILLSYLFFLFIATSGSGLNRPVPPVNTGRIKLLGSCLQCAQFAGLGVVTLTRGELSGQPSDVPFPPETEYLYVVPPAVLHFPRTLSCGVEIPKSVLF